MRDDVERKEEQMVYIQKCDGDKSFYRSHSPVIKCKFPNKENVLDVLPLQFFPLRFIYCYAEVFVWFSPRWKKKA